MAISSLGAVKRDLLSLLGELVAVGTRTAEGASATATLIDTSQYFPDDYFNDHLIYVFAGTGVGQERLITDWDATNQRFTVSANWGTSLDGTSEYYVTRRRFNNAHISAALDQAMNWLRKELVVPVENASVLMPNPASTFVISLGSYPPSGAGTFWAAISKIYRQNADGNAFDLILPGPNDTPAPWWYMRRHWTGSNWTHEIVLDRNVHDNNGFIINGRTCKIVGFRYLIPLAGADSTNLPVNPAPIIQMASALLRLGEREPTQIEAAMATIRRMTRQLGSGLPPGVVMVEDA